MKSPSSRRPTKAPVARSNTRLRFIFLLKSKSKLSSVSWESRKRGLLAAPFQRSFTTAIQFIRHQTGKQIDRGHALGLCLMQAGFQHFRHAAESQLLECAVQFNEIHSLAPWFGG